MTATVVVQTLNVPEETPELLAVAEANPLVRGVVGWVDLRGSGVGDRIADLRALPGGDRLVGFRHLAQDESDDEWSCRSDVLEGLGDVEDSGLVYDVLVRSHQLRSAITAARARPTLRFVLDHFGKPPIATGEIEPWRSLITELARCENVVVKFSGLVTEANLSKWSAKDLRPYVDVVLSAFGPRRMMFGSDWPVCQLAATYHEVVSVAQQLTSQLSAAEEGLVFGATAEHWYGLDLT